MYKDAPEIRQINNADTLRTMLAQCEDEIMRLAKRAKGTLYWPRDVEDLVREELSTRACILNHMFTLHCTEAEVHRFEEVNAALLKLEEMHGVWHKHINNQISRIHGLDGDPFDIEMAINGSIDEDTPLFQMEEDSYYGSRWREMLDAICENSQIDAMVSCEEGMEDGVSWAEGPLCIPQLEHITVCYLVHSLCTHLDYSIPDILRMTTYRIDYRLNSGDFITLNPGVSEPIKIKHIKDDVKREMIESILHLNFKN